MLAKADAATTTTVGGFDPGHFESLVAVEDRHFWFRVRSAIISTALSRITMKLPEGYRVLEVGCGTGNVLRVLEKHCVGGTVFGIDLFNEGIEYARRRVQCTVMAGDIKDQQFDAPFDIIGMFDVLEHIEGDHAALQQMRDLLNPGGRILLTVPAHPKLWSDFDVASHHYRRYTESSLRAVFSSAGFQIEYLTPFMSLLYPLMRFKRRASDPQTVTARSTVDHEFRVIPFINALAHAALLPETIFVRRGWRLPMGTSLLAIARTSKS